MIPVVFLLMSSSESQSINLHPVHHGIHKIIQPFPNIIGMRCQRRERRESRRYRIIQKVSEQDKNHCITVCYPSESEGEQHLSILCSCIQIFWDPINIYIEVWQITVSSSTQLCLLLYSKTRWASLDQLVLLHIVYYSANKLWRKPIRFRS